MAEGPSVSRDTQGPLARETRVRGLVKEGFMTWALETLGSHNSYLPEHHHHAPLALVSCLPLQ